MIEIKEKISYKDLLSFDFFSSMGENSVSHILSESKLYQFEKNEFIIHEDTYSDEIYFLLDGTVKVTKKLNNGDSDILGYIEKGSFFGENLIFGEKSRIATVSSLGITTVLIIKFKTIENLNDKEIYVKFLKIFHIQTVLFLKKTNNKISDINKKNKNISIFLINIVLFMSIYSIFQSTFNQIIKTIDAKLVTTSIILSGNIFLFIRLKLLKIPIEKIGIKNTNLKKSLLESAIISFLIILAFIFLKYILIKYTSTFHHGTLFNSSKRRAFIERGVIRSHYETFMLCFLYFFHAIFQEILVRGAMQTTFQELFNNKYKNFFAIFLSSLVFASCHSYFGIYQVFFVFFPGLFWGWMFHRQGNIFGAGLSHALIGLSYVEFIGPF